MSLGSKGIESDVEAAAKASVFAGGGELGARMRAMDWSATALGPVHRWPQALKTTLRIVLTSSQPMFVWWGDELINLYNDAYKSIIGGKHPQAIGQPASVVWREIWDQVEPRAKSAIQRNEGTYDEALLLIMERHGYREETYYTFSYSPVPNDEGGAGGIFCANTDDTQRIISERQLALLREVTARMADARTATEACEAGAASFQTNPFDVPFALIYLFDSERRTAQLHGASGIERGHAGAPATISLDDDSVWPLAEVARKNDPLIVHDLAARVSNVPCGTWEDPPHKAVALPVASSSQTGVTGALIVGLNPYRLFDASYERFLNLLAGQIGAALANAQAYEQERKRAEALFELDRAKTTFFSNVSHEFRTPLTLMLGPLEEVLARPEGAASAEGRQLVDLAHRSGVRLLKLVNSLLDFSRIEAGRVKAAYQPTDIAAFTAELTSVFESATQRAGLRLEFSADHIHESIYIDRDMWEKIVLNLLSNAFKFTFDGGIGVAIKDAGPAIELSVADTGTGIPDAELPRLFERFHRVEGARGRSFEGSGIGLALVHELVKLHGGSISVESTLGRGTTFHISIPKGTAHLPQDRIAAARGTTSAATGAEAYVEEALRWLPQSQEPPSISADRLTELVDVRGGAMSSAIFQDVAGSTILLADDNGDMREYLRRLLSENYRVITVANGQEALDALAQQRPDLVLTDVMMPVLDGFGLLSAIRANPDTTQLPVVMLSARAGEEASVEGLAAGADDYLVKPFTARELLTRVTSHLRLNKLRQESGERERRLRAEAVAERNRIRHLFLSAPVPIAALSGPEHRFVLANERYASVVGRSIDSLLDRPARVAIPELESQGLIDLLDDVYRTGVPYIGNEVPVTLERAGQPPAQAFFNFGLHPTLGLDGDIEGVLVIAVDVSEQVLARTALVKSEKLAAVGRLSATIAHEINNPLEAVTNLVWLLKQDGSMPAYARDYLKTADEELARVSHLTKQTLAFYRGGSEHRKLPLGDMIEGVLSIFAPRLRNKGVRLHKQVEPDSLGIRVDGDVRQVITNLVGNSLDAVPVDGQIWVRCARVGRDGTSGVRLTIADNGAGVPKQLRHKIFEPFFSTKSDMGTGLGLWVAKGIVERHKGSIRLRSSTHDPRTYTAFSIFLPEDRGASVDETRVMTA